MDRSFKQIESRVLRHVRSIRDNDDLNVVILAIKTAQARLERDTANALSVGMSVTVTNGGVTTDGVVEKVNRKNTIVTMNLGKGDLRYKVPNFMIATA